MTSTTGTTAMPVRHQMELTFELPGTADQVWRAIATENGINAWMLRTDLEEREGGAVRFHMGEDLSSPGTVTGYDPPRRFAYEEPEWALLVGRDTGSVTPLATEFLIEATSGGTCVLRVVSSAFGTGADWEEEFFTDMKVHWSPQFDTLRLYLEHFADRSVTVADLDREVRASPEATWRALRAAVGGTLRGDEVRVPGADGVLERIQDGRGPWELLIRTSAPAPGLVALMAWGTEEEGSVLSLAVRLFCDDAAALLSARRDDWEHWLAAIAATAEQDQRHPGT